MQSNASMLRFLALLLVLTSVAQTEGAAQPAGDDPATSGWPEGFRAVKIPRSDRMAQPAMLHRATKNGQPLVVALHTWSGDWKQRSSSLAAEAAAKGWNYIHPNFGGPNDHPGACCSDQAIADLDAAIAYGLAQTDADRARVYVVGASGGGYAALCHLMRGKRSVTSYDAWVPISDLAAWHDESAERGSKYHRDVLACTGSEGGVLDVEEARRRSPLHFPVPLDKLDTTRVRLYTGIRDGYDGSVPITHSLHFYNKLAARLGAPDSALVPPGDMVHMLATLDGPGRAKRTLGGRDVLYHRSHGTVSLVVFQGRHEMLEWVALGLAAGNTSPLDTTLEGVETQD